MRHDLSLEPVSDDARMLRDSAGDYFGVDTGFQRMRSARNSPGGLAPGSWQDMARRGWLGIRVAEEFGGSAGDWQALGALLEEAGKGLAPEPLVDTAVIAAGLVAQSEQEELKRTVLPQLVAGSYRIAPALLGKSQEPSLDTQPVRAQPHDTGFRLTGTRHGVVAAETADAFLVAAMGPDGGSLYLVDRSAAGVSLETSVALDGTRCSRVHLQDVLVPADRRIAGPASAQVLLAGALDEARLAASAYLLGVMGRALATTVEYIKLREQFGRPVGSFQVLQHRCVDMLMQVEISRAVVARALAVFDSDAAPQARAMAASQAKARCSAAAIEVTRGCIQLHGGIGFTDECHIGLFMKRALVVAAWLGTADYHRQRYLELSQGPVSGATPPPWLAPVGEWVAANYPAAWRFPVHRLALRETLSWHRALFRQGWVAPGWPREHGGMGLSANEQVLMQDVLDAHGVDIAVNMGILMLGPLLMRYGTAEQRQHYLPKILSGDTLWCQGYSEPGAGSDLAALRTRAELDGEEFVVNGQKIWTSLAHEADMIFLLARTEPNAKKQSGISFLLVDMKSPGVTVKRIQNLTGTSEFCEVFFENVRVPRANIVGELNQGWTMAKSLLGSERIMIGNPRLARLPLRLLECMARASGDFDDPVFRSEYARLLLDVDDLSAAFVRFANVLERGQELGAEVSMLKIWVTETYQRVCDLMMRRFPEQGAHGEVLQFDSGARVHPGHQYLVSLPSSIYSGTNEILRNVLAKALLGLPS